MRLTPLLPEDAAEVASWYADDTFRRMMDARARSPRTPEDIRTEIAEGAEKGNGCTYGVRTVPGDVLIGKASLFDIVWPHRAVWMSLGLAPAHQGQGYGGEALRLLLNEAFGRLGLTLVLLTVYDYNARAIALYARHGFTQDGAMHPFRGLDGERHRVLRMSLSAEVWRARTERVAL